MNSLLQTCIHTFRYAVTLETNQPAFKIIPLKQFVTRLFTGLLPQPQIDHLADTLLAVVNGTTCSLASLKTIEPYMTHGGILEERLSSLDQILNELTAIKTALFSPLTMQADLILEDIGIFSYIQQLYIEADREQPDFVFIGMVSPDQPRLQVPLDPTKAFLNRIAISYLADPPYPLLTVSVGSSAATALWQLGRRDWVQKAMEDHDLHLSMRTRELGKIRTRVVKTSFSAIGRRVCLTIPAIPNAMLLETTVLGKQDKPLVTCLKVSSV